MRRALLAVLLPAAFLLPSGGVVAADGPSYRFLEGGLIDVEIDRSSIRDFDDDGYFLGGSFGWRFIHVFAEFQDIGDFEATNVGVGWNGLLGERADLVAQLTWQDIDIDLDGGPDVDDDGTIVSVGVRWQILKILEVNGFLNAPDLDDLDEDYVWDVNAILMFGRAGIGAGWESSDEDRDTARVFFRWMFGR